MAELLSTKVKTLNIAIAVTGTAIPLSSDTAPINDVLISAPSTNTGIIYIGASSVTNTAGAAGNGYRLESGKDISIPAKQLSDLYINGTAGDYVSVIAV